MINQIRVLIKSITEEIDTPKAIWKLVYTAIGYVSSFFSLAVLFKDLMEFDKLELWIKENWGIVAITGIFISCLHNRKKVDYCKRVLNSDLQIAISVKDIFQNRIANSYVIPTNTFFRTKMDKEYVSPNSVQGRFQLKYFKGNIPNLDNLIHENLNSQGITGVLASDCFGSTTKYPVGTVAKIDNRGKHFYFVAITDVDEFGKPINQSIENITIALAAVTRAIKHFDVLCIPLLGSGRAAIQEATKEDVFERTVNHFTQPNNQCISKLIISINPKDYLDGKFDLDRMKKYLDYRCEF